MGVKEILGKLFGHWKSQEGEKLSPDEVELRSYMEEEKRDKLKVLLAKYRKKKDREILLGTPFLTAGEQKRTLTKKHLNILDAHDSFGFR